ncbi:MAG TPA: HNH endonuclease signature motif containing protein, partial [Acidimicrobiales bacterium]|nr:HNH endonuclease signature motif containing protein [Acidimicrobiales bacterium]
PPWCEAHHIVHYSDGGPTSIDNLVLGCTRHHHLWHSQGWQLSLAPDGTLRLISPRGLVMTSTPPALDLLATVDG